MSYIIKQALIFHADKPLFTPLLATVLHMIVTQNVTSKREALLLVAIDEPFHGFTNST